MIPMSTSTTAPVSVANQRSPLDRLDLVTSYFPATLSASAATVRAGLWKGSDHADQLRETTPGLRTWRNDSVLYAWNMDGAPYPEGFETVVVRFEENPALFKRLLNDAVRARFRTLGFTEKRRAFVNYEKASLLGAIPGLAAAGAESIGIYPKIIADGWYTRTAKDELTLGLVVDVLYTTRLDLSVSEWFAAGLREEIVGEYVTLLRDSPEALAYPALVGRVIGRVSGIRTGNLVLTDRREKALVEVATSSAAPEATRRLLELYLAARYKNEFKTAAPALKQKLTELVRPETRYRLMIKAVERLDAVAEPLQLLPGLTATLKAPMRVAHDTFPVRELTGPTYSFDRAGNKLERKIDTGLQKFGPYDRESMSRQSPRLLVVGPADHKGEIEVVVKKFLDGIKSSTIFAGLRSMYRLDRLDVRIEYARVSNDAPMAGYIEAVRSATRQASPPFDVALIVIRQEHRALPDSENPYFQTKGFMLGVEGTPTQAITVEKLRSRDYDLQYILNTAALALYAKLGGTSHVLRLDEKDSPTELVFGVGRAITRKERFGITEETIGFTTVFRANGEYLYNDCTPYCEGDDYERALEEAVRRSVERVAAFEQLPAGSPLRLVFHIHRRTGRREVGPILNAIHKLPQFNIEFALLHVNEDHHLQFFEMQSRSLRGGTKEVACVPPRGLSISVGANERLVSFVGPKQYRGLGAPTPLKIALDAKSTFTDLEYLTQQLYLLSFMSARSLSPGIKPATISYSEQLARITGHLRGVQAWTLDLVQKKLGEKLWFI
jgi:argonaute-like protein